MIKNLVLPSKYKEKKIKNKLCLKEMNWFSLLSVCKSIYCLIV